MSLQTGIRWRVASLLISVSPGLLSWAPSFPQEQGAPAEEVAIIVNRANTSPDPSFEDLRAILELKKQFWSDGKRVVLLLPPTGSGTKQLLLERIYHRTDPQLRQDWARRLFAGEIPAVPTTIRSVEAQVAAVAQSGGAITAVPAGTALPASVRVIAVDGKRPGEQGYRLSADKH